MDAVGRADTDLLTAPEAVGERAARYDAWFTTPIGQAMDPAESEAMLERANPRPRERALDAGCGTGMYTRRLTERGAIVTGVDRDPAMLAAARVRAPAATLVEGETTALPFEHDVFDLALAVTILCFVADPQRAVSELVRVTRPGGRVVLAELGRLSMWAAKRRVQAWRGSESWAHARFYSPHELVALLEGAGASDVQTATAAYLPPATPGWLISRAAAVERCGRRLGAFGAAFVLARGELGGP